MKQEDQELVRAIAREIARIEIERYGAQWLTAGYGPTKETAAPPQEAQPPEAEG